MKRYIELAAKVQGLAVVAVAGFLQIEPYSAGVDFVAVLPASVRLQEPQIPKLQVGFLLASAQSGFQTCCLPCSVELTGT